MVPLKRVGNPVFGSALKSPRSCSALVTTRQVHPLGLLKDDQVDPRLRVLLPQRCDGPLPHSVQGREAVAVKSGLVPSGDGLCEVSILPVPTLARLRGHAKPAGSVKALRRRVVNRMLTNEL